MDDNPRIMELIAERLAKGIKEYGHGLRQGDDTTEWGTRLDSWVEMGLEEALDLSIYLAIALVRIETERNALKQERAELEALKNNVQPEKVVAKRMPLWRRVLWGNGEEGGTDGGE
jgi:hypothetical protein